MASREENLMEKIVSLCKRRGFVYPGSEIYGGLAGTFDYGPLGLALKNNVKNLWWNMFVETLENMYGVDAAILMHSEVWKASGHVSGFSDPVIECKNCKKRWRTDHIIESQLIEKGSYLCPSCRKVLGTEKELVAQTRQFNMMFETRVGAGEEGAVTYLRPETAGGIFVNFKNIVDSFHPKLPFGIAQIGKAFRNEISPRDFLFRTREFEQMEIEYFVRPNAWEQNFEEWRQGVRAFFTAIGIPEEALHELEVPQEERAHYSKRTIDFEFDFPFGRKELCGLTYRSDFDLTAHQSSSGTDLSYPDEESGERFVPHVIEPSFGVDRTVLAILASAYDEDELGGEKRTVLRLKPSMAPIKVAVFPLLKNKPELVAKAKDIYADLKREIPQVVWDDNGNIGKRYRRQDEIGTPSCITVDFQTLEDGTVTLRDRDSGEQRRVPAGELSKAIPI